VLWKIAVNTWRIIVAAFALVAVALVVSVCLAALQQPGHMGIWNILRAGLVCGVLIVMVFMMVSYLARSFRIKKVP
jgi:hypothetical protein